MGLMQPLNKEKQICREIDTTKEKRCGLLGMTPREGKYSGELGKMRAVLVKPVTWIPPGASSGRRRASEDEESSALPDVGGGSTFLLGNVCPAFR